MPLDGGTDNQDAEWVEQIQCATSASDEVKYIEQKKQDDEIKAQQQQARLKNR